jgi:hypothetical protein
MGTTLLELGSKETDEVITFYIDASKYGWETPVTFISASSVIYDSADNSKTDLPALHLYDPTISGYRIYQTIGSGSDGHSYVWEVTFKVSGSNDVYKENAKFSVVEV